MAAFSKRSCNRTLTMDQPPLPNPPNRSESPLPATTSLPARLLNVFATPGEVFAEVVTTKPSVSNWLVPVIISCFVGVIAAVVLLSQPSILHKIREQQQATLEKSVKAGKMTQAQADEAMEVIEKFSSPIMMSITGSIATIFGKFIGLFLWALGLWLLALLFFKQTIP